MQELKSTWAHFSFTLCPNREWDAKRVENQQCCLAPQRFPVDCLDKRGEPHSMGIFGGLRSTAKAFTPTTERCGRCCTFFARNSSLLLVVHRGAGDLFAGRIGFSQVHRAG